MNYNVSIREGIEELGIFEKNTDAWVSTRAISRLFGKEHKDILAIIREQIIPNITEEFSRRNFPPSKSKDSRGKMQPEFLLNRKSFAMVVMGFTGKKAMAFKEAYIEAFEAMCTVIDTRQISKAGYKEMTAAIKRTFTDQRAYAIEADMINQIVLGMKASDFREVHSIENGNTRDGVVFDKLAALDRAQRLNAQLITAGVPFATRQSIIETNFGRRAA